MYKANKNSLRSEMFKLLPTFLFSKLKTKSTPLLLIANAVLQISNTMCHVRGLTWRCGHNWMTVEPCGATDCIAELDDSTRPLGWCCSTLCCERKLAEAQNVVENAEKESKAEQSPSKRIEMRTRIKMRAQYRRELSLHFGGGCMQHFVDGLGKSDAMFDEMEEARIADDVPAVDVKSFMAESVKRNEPEFPIRNQITGYEQLLVANGGTFNVVPHPNTALEQFHMISEYIKGTEAVDLPVVRFDLPHTTSQSPPGPSTYNLPHCGTSSTTTMPPNMMAPPASVDALSQEELQLAYLRLLYNQKHTFSVLSKPKLSVAQQGLAAALTRLNESSLQAIPSLDSKGKMPAAQPSFDMSQLEGYISLMTQLMQFVTQYQYWLVEDFPAKNSMTQGIMWVNRRVKQDITCYALLDMDKYVLDRGPIPPAMGEKEIAEFRQHVQMLREIHASVDFQLGNWIDEQSPADQQMLAARWKDLEKVEKARLKNTVAI